jgi:hypothetical protein
MRPLGQLIESLNENIIADLVTWKMAEVGDLAERLIDERREAAAALTWLCGGMTDKVPVAWMIGGEATSRKWVMEAAQSRGLVIVPLYAINQISVWTDCPPAPASAVHRGADEEFKLDAEELETIMRCIENGQPARVTPFEIRELLRVYRIAIGAIPVNDHDNGNDNDLNDAHARGEDVER